MKPEIDLVLQLKKASPINSESRNFWPKTKVSVNRWELLNRISDFQLVRSVD